jgi:S-adenosylmethionine:tRNA ribosyltransferase-isomerase
LGLTAGHRVGVDVSEFDYQLPGELIAQHPAQPRDAARLLAHEVDCDRTRHCAVRDLVEVLRPGDLLITNDTRVRAARLFGARDSGGHVELLLLEEHSAPPESGAVRWRALVRPAGRIKPGEEFDLEGGALRARALSRIQTLGQPPGAEWTVEIRAHGPAQSSTRQRIEDLGRMPLPPYIHRERAHDVHREADREQYQTVYGARSGAVAAPTAGLHFTNDLLTRLADRGVERASITLHVGAGTFRPVTARCVEDHVMHAEQYELPEETAHAVERARARGGRVVAVGTTSARVLESCVDDRGNLRASAGETSIFITPGHRLRAIDALLTNFHLPRSTLLMLVCAFAGRDRVLRLYAEAIERRYRFYSYGDAMLLQR